MERTPTGAYRGGLLYRGAKEWTDKFANAMGKMVRALEDEEKSIVLEVLPFMSAVKLYDEKGSDDIHLPFNSSTVNEKLESLRLYCTCLIIRYKPSSYILSQFFVNPSISLYHHRPQFYTILYKLL
jgi:hypothetical protein